MCPTSPRRGYAGQTPLSFILFYEDRQLQSMVYQAKLPKVAEFGGR